MQGIVLAGVHPWGESGLERICPRPLLPVAGQPLVAYALEWLRDGGIGQASICANSDTQTFRSCLGRGARIGIELDYYADVMPRGPAGCMRDAAVRAGAETFIAVDGTIVTDIDLGAVLHSHLSTGASLTMVVSSAGDAGAGGGLEPVGVYVVSRAAIEAVPAKGYQDIKEVLIPQLYRKGLAVVPYIVEAGRTQRLTGTSSYLSVTSWAIRRAVSDRRFMKQYRRAGGACVHESARVGEGACLIGPVLVGPGTVIEPGATIVGPSTIGADCHVARGAVLRRASVWSNSRLGAGAILDSSVLVCGSTVEPEAVLRNTVYQTSEWQPTSAADLWSLYWRLGLCEATGPAKEAEDLARAGETLAVAGR